MIIYILLCLRRKPSEQLASVDAIVPAFNEGPCLESSLHNLLGNPYISQVICVDDGSTDETPQVLEQLQKKWGERLIVIHQSNTGKGGALMKGIKRSSAQYVFLTDADTRVPQDNGLGYMLAEIENGADAVGGIPSSDLRYGKFLPHIRATVKMPMIIMKRTLQQFLGGAPFIISGACGMFRREILLRHGFSDRTRVEDLDLTWTLIANGFRIRQCNRCIVYPQECSTIREEWRRWRRWIVGYAVCMRLHSRLLFSRYGLFSIIPMVLVVIYGVAIYCIMFGARFFSGEYLETLHILFPIVWIGLVCCIGAFSAYWHRSPLLVVLAPLSVFYVLLSYLIWILYGTIGFFTGREPRRDKPTRYKPVVETA
jgi:cellulose synthase/poly-beta-1,6-N-acetylglucosamine synthase-like glycosyltransferase